MSGSMGDEQLTVMRQRVDVWVQRTSTIWSKRVDVWGEKLLTTIIGKWA